MTHILYLTLPKVDLLTHQTSMGAVGVTMTTSVDRVVATLVNPATTGETLVSYGQTTTSFSFSANDLLAFRNLC